MSTSWGKVHPLFDTGTVKAVSPRKIALFHEGAVLPLLLEDNTPENWAKLYNKANDNGIAVNGLIPSPSDVESLGLGVIRDAAGQWENARSAQWQIEEYRRTCAQDRHSIDPVQLLKTFRDHPYTAGTAVPPFILQDESGSATYTGFSFKSADGNGRYLTLARKSPEGNEETSNQRFVEPLVRNRFRTALSNHDRQRRYSLEETGDYPGSFTCL